MTTAEPSPSGATPDRRDAARGARVPSSSRMSHGTRERMVAGAARAIGCQGVDAMSLRVLADTEGVPLGSTYHHFPGGKAQLVEEAVTFAGRQIVEILETSRVQGTANALSAFADAWRRILERTGYRQGCAVLAAATATDPRHHATAHTAFEKWNRALTESLVASGVPEDRAPRLAVTIVAAVEGAVALARAEGTAAPLDAVVAELATIVEGAAR
ncbi:MAG: TetR/AcrR family transcriptional regulator [Phycicoccus sp.]